MKEAGFRMVNSSVKFKNGEYVIAENDGLRKGIRA